MRTLLTSLAVAVSVALLLLQTPSWAQEALYKQRGSLVTVLQNGSNLRIIYDSPSEERRREGAKKGDIVFTGKVQRNYAEGMAWLYDSRCGNIDYHVYGDFRLGRPFTLNGAAPVYGAINCRILDNVYDSPEANLVFEPAPSSTPRPPLARPVGSLREGSRLCVANVNTTLNVRIAPGNSNPVITEIDKHRCGIILAGICQSGWCPVKSGDDIGWASSNYLRADR